MPMLISRAVVPSGKVANDAPLDGAIHVPIACSIASTPGGRRLCGHFSFRKLPGTSTIFVTFLPFR